MSKSPISAIILQVANGERMQADGFSVEALGSPDPLTRSEVKQLRRFLRWNMAAHKHGHYLAYTTEKQSEALFQIADSLIEQVERDEKKSPVERLKEMLDATAAEAAAEVEATPADKFKAKEVRFLRYFYQRVMQLQKMDRTFHAPNSAEREALAELIDERIEAKRKAAAQAAASTPPVAEAVARIDPEDTPHLLVLTFSTGYVSHVVLHAPQGENPEDMVDEAINELPAEDATTLTQIEVFRIEQLKSVHTYIAPKHDYLTTEDQASS